MRACRNGPDDCTAAAALTTAVDLTAAVALIATTVAFAATLSLLPTLTATAALTENLVARFVSPCVFHSAGCLGRSGVNTCGNTFIRTVAAENVS